MTFEDFADWWGVHLDCFPGFAEWAKPNTPFEWHKAFFTEIPLDDACEASRELLQSCLDMRFGRHPHEIVARAIRIRRRREADAEAAQRAKTAAVKAAPTCPVCNGGRFVNCSVVGGSSIPRARHCTYCEDGLKTYNTQRNPSTQAGKDSLRKFGEPQFYDPRKHQMHGGALQYEPTDAPPAVERPWKPGDDPNREF